MSSIPRHEVEKKVEKSFENKVIFMAMFNPWGPNMSQIINRQFYLIKNSLFLHNIFPYGSILVDNKWCPNFKDLLVRGNPYNIKHDLTDTVPNEYKPCSKNVSCVIILLEVNHIWISMLLEESIAYIEIVLALNQMLYIWHIATNVTSNNKHDINI